ncbi:MAG: serine/threonine-protein kinase [Bacilli bacterium]
MKKIDINKLKINDDFDGGSFAVVRKCEYEDNFYALKEFHEQSKAFTTNFINKINSLSLINNNSLVTPKILVTKNDVPIAYLSKYIDGKIFDFLYNQTIAQKISVLKKGKEKLLQMHEEGLIHSDIHYGNIMYNDNSVYFIDFDNCSYKRYKTKLNLTTDFAQEFIKKYGVCKEIDVAMFNYLTFSLVNSNSFFLTRNEIIKQNYGYFYDNDSIKICNNLLLTEKYPTTDFLIDSIKRNVKYR